MTLLTFLATAGWYDGRWDGPPWPGFFLFPLFLAALLVSGLLLLRGRRPGTAVSIVAQRYAKGEIDEDEYRRRVAELRGKPSAAAPTAKEAT